MQSNKHAALDKESEKFVSAPSSPLTFHIASLHGDCPINSLPPELLSFIFDLAHPKQHTPQTVPFEVILSHVSRYWRSVVHGTSMMWTNITIYSPRSMTWVPSYLQRSGSQTPLIVNIDAYRWDESLTSSDRKTRRIFATTIAQDLTPYLDRIRSLSIMCYHEYTSATIRRLLSKASAKNLRQFKIKFERNMTGTHRHNNGTELFDGGSPRLTFLDTAVASYLPSLSSLANLTTLLLNPIHVAANIAYPDLVNVFAAVPSLVHLSITGGSQNLVASWPMHLTAPDFQMPNLQSLQLIDHGMLAVKTMLSISAPKLESLWLHCSLSNFNHLFDAPQMDPNVTLVPKFAKLRYFTLAHNDDFSQSVRFAKIFPNIVYLHLPYANFYHAYQLQTALAWHWRALRTLVLTVVREVKWLKLSIILPTVLQARRQANHPIETLLIDRDYRRMLERGVPTLSQQVNIEDLTPQNYHETWWNKAEEKDLD